jgi:outer membrane protein TolC
MGQCEERERNRPRLLFVFGGFFFWCLAAIVSLRAQTLTQPQRPVSTRPTTQPSSQPITVSGLPVAGQQTLPGAARISAPPAQLTLSAAIDLALANNLATLLAQEQKRAAAGVTEQARSALLPYVSGAAYQASITLNLAALGFQPGTFPGISQSFIGPFNNFDARASLVQKVFDLSAIRNYQSGHAGERVAEYQERLAREQVSEATALTYLETLRTDREVAAAEANVELATTLFKLAQDQHSAGVATGVDVTRAETRLAQERVGLAQARTASEQARLNLQRVIGVPLGSPLVLTDPLRFVDEPLPATDAAVAQALAARNEVFISTEQVKMLQLESKSIKGELLPSLEFVADYGLSGITPTNLALPTRRVAIQLNVPIFNGGLTQGRLAVATSREHQAELELSSIRGQVEEDVRLALSGLRTTVERVRAADEALRLAQKELEMARDRFAAGVADNLEVVTAQTSLANARAAQVEALAVYNASRLNLAAALGRAETFRW